MLTGSPTCEPTPRSDTGFALVETLVAFAILGIALGVLLGVFGDGARRQGQAERITAATLQAQSVLAQVGTAIPLKIGMTAGTSPDGSRWQLRIDHYGDAGDRKAWPTQPYSVIVEVIAGDGEPEGPLARLATLRLGPGEPAR